MHKGNLEKIRLIEKLNFVEEYKVGFRQVIYSNLLKDDIKTSRILDFGCSLRSYSQVISKNAGKYVTADINKDDDIDITFDLCEEKEIPAELKNKFNNVVALAIFEHLWNPFTAAKNIVDFLDKSQKSRIWIYAPFLYKYHAPEDLIYQDYFRFTKDAWPILFPDAKKIILSPVRGTGTTSLNLAIPFYKDLIEKKFKFIYKLSKLADNFYSKRSNFLQTSGYNVIIEF